jgi:hypothetical protein
MYTSSTFVLTYYSITIITNPFFMGYVYRYSKTNYI